MIVGATVRLVRGEMHVTKWVYLLTAILTEVTATSALKASDGFKRFWPSVIVVVGYALSFYLMSLTLREIPVGVTYAIWSGVGVILITLVALIVYGQRLDLPAIAGMLLIVIGVMVMNLFSRAVPR